MKAHPSILIVDLGSQLTLVIARLLRECGYRSVVLSPQQAGEWVVQHKPDAIILSGSDKSVHNKDAPQPPRGILNLGVPILGICYGMQWLVHHFGGVVANDHNNVEYGPASITIPVSNRLFSDTPLLQRVWASHGDSVLKLPDGFDVIASDDIGKDAIRAISSSHHNVWGVQFHPEVEQTTYGKSILKNFVHHICGCSPDWEPKDIVADVHRELGKDKSIRAILGFSGGVDSTVTGNHLFTSPWRSLPWS